MAETDSKQTPARVKDETGNPHGKLTVLSYAGTDLKSQKGAYWHCRCECGGDTVVCGRALRSGSIASCGCQQRTDETAKVYGKLTVESFAGTRRKLAHWLCRCECGNMTTVAGADLRRGSIVSCGCKRARAGGMCNSPEYTSWRGMKRRCYNPNAPYYHLYGGKSITVCQRWLDAFVNFLEDMGEKPFPSATIHRINGSANYEPGNCKWASKEEQALHTSKTRKITYKGETKSLRGWARTIGITHRTLSARLDRGWSLEKALTTPANQAYDPTKHK